MIKPGLLEILRCPETHQELRQAEPALIEQLNRLIAGGSMRNRAGQPVKEILQGGLVRADGRCLYPIWRDIPVILPDQALALENAQA